MGLFEPSKNIVIDGIAFNKVSIGDKDMFEQYYSDTKYDVNLWVMNFTYTLGFGDSNSRKVLWKIIDGLLCVFVVKRDLTDIFMLYPPVGKSDKMHFNRVVAMCMKLMLKINKGNKDKSMIRTINKNHVDMLSEKHFKCKKSSFGFEHIYSTSGVSDMQGKDFSYVRRKFNKFTKEYPQAIWRRYEKSDWNSMLDLKKQWEDTAGEKYFRIIDASYYKATLTNHEMLNHDVFVVELNGNIIGMISGGVLSVDRRLAWCFLRKPLNNYDGLSEYLIIMLCREYKDRADVLNDGADGGGGGLRFFKERFKPVVSNQVYSCQLK